MSAKKAFTVFMLMVLCLLPIKESIASPIVEDQLTQIETPETEASTGIAPTSDLNDSGTSSLSGSKVTFDPTAGGDACYFPSTPQTFCFKSETYTNDWEYVYNNWIKFPSDWTVSNVYVQGTPVCDLGTWGSFSWSFLTSPYEVNVAQTRNQQPTDHCVATYCVDVTPSGFADPAEMSWYFDGDGYAAAPHNPCSSDGYTPAGQTACDEMINPVAAVPSCAATHQVVLTPDEITTSGCRGEAQFHILTLTNLTGAESTFDITYNKDFPGDIIGPDHITLADGATTTFDVMLDPHLCTANSDYTATVTVSDGTYSDQSTIYYEIFYELVEWRSIQTSPIVRMDNVLAAYDGKVWNIAGYGTSGEVNYYDPTSDSWTTIPASAPPWGAASYPRSGCQIGNEVFVYGDASTPGYTGLWSYNMDTNTWTQETPSGTPPPHAGIWGTAWVGHSQSGLCFMTGGATTPGAGNLTTVYVYNTIGNAWLPELPPFASARDFHAAFLFNRPSDSHDLLCVAGGVNSASVAFDSTQCYDFSTAAWNAEYADLGALPNAWWGMGYAQLEGELWLVEGADGAFAIYNQSAYYDIEDGEWVIAGPLPSGSVYRTAAVSLDGSIYHVGGSTGSFNPSGLSDKYIDLVCPECHVPDMTKQATELALPGQTIHYNITLDPMVIDSALVYDFLPDSVAYVPGSLTVTPEIGEYGYDTISESIWWYYGSIMANANGWTPARKSGTSSTTDITAQSGAPATVVQVGSIDTAINSVLWDQPLSSINQNAYANQDFLDSPDYSTYLADDFEVSVPWLIESIFVPGHGWNGFSSLLNANVLTFMLYKDKVGIPAGDPSGAGALPVWVYRVLPTDPQITITTGSGGLPSNTQLDLSSPILLPPGHYWFIFYPSMSFTTGGQFGRQPADTMNAHSARVINPGGGFGYGTVWEPWMVWWGFDSDMAFRIEGMEVPNLQIEFDAIVTAPLNHVIWNSSFLEYGSYISQANDETFTGYGVFLPMTIK